MRLHTELQLVCASVARDPKKERGEAGMGMDELIEQLVEAWDRSLVRKGTGAIDVTPTNAGPCFLVKMG
jgi:hypothetical protein